MSAMPFVVTGSGASSFLDADTASPQVDEGRSDIRNAPGHLGLGVGGADRAERDDTAG